MRIFEESVGERFVGRRLLVAEHAGQQSHHGIRDNQRGQRAIGQNVIAERNFLVDQVLGHPLVDPLVVPGDHDEMLFPGQTLGRGLVEAPALRGKENDPRGRLTEFLQRHGDWLDLEHHAGAATVGRFVGHPVFARRPIAEIA